MKKKISALLLSLALCAGLLAGCGAGETAEAPSDTDVQQVDSLKIAFSPYADADLISESTEPLEELLKAKLLEKGYDVGEIDMTVGTSYTAVGEALSAGSADLGFISGGNYVLFSDDCDVLLTALRYAINKDSENPADWNDGTIEENTEDMSTYYRCILLAGPSEKGQELLSKVNAGEELTWDDLNSATWAVLNPTSASGYIYPSLWLQEHYGKGISDLDNVVECDSHTTSVARLAAGQVDVMVSYGHIRIKNAPIWESDFGGTAPMVEQTGVIGVTDGIYNDMQAALEKSTDATVTGPIAERIVWAKMIDSMMMLLVGLIAVAVLIALVGVANTLSLSVIERTRESATLRAIGMTRGQLRASLAIEALLISVVSGLVGILLGTLFGWLGAYVVFSLYGTVAFPFEWGINGIVLAVAAVAALLASIAPARRAVRVPPVEALAEA